MAARRELQEAAGFAAEWARRIRELRNEEGYQILSHKDRASLKPGQYLMETDKRVPAFARSISKETRAYVLERNGYTCQMCGAGAGDQDPFNPARKIRLTLAHIIDKSKGGEDTPTNLVLSARTAMKACKMQARPSRTSTCCWGTSAGLPRMTKRRS